jgi:hypothetical protein
MDPYDRRAPFEALPPQTEDVRRSLGLARRWAGRLDLAKALPRPELASSGYCLAEPGEAYLAYLPDDGAVEMDLGDASGPFEAEWLDPAIGRTLDGGRVAGGQRQRLASPCAADAVLYLKAARR